MERKIVVVDVGCRWGFADEFIKNSESFTVYGFDPDPDECNRLNQIYESNTNVRAVPYALDETSGEKILYLTKDPACSSLYQPDPFLTENYAAFHCEIEIGRAKIQTTTLDEWTEKSNISHIDHIKIDTQGSELNILKGAVNILDSVRSIEVEVEFNPMYLGQPLFHEVDRFLREHGFMLWKFSEITHYSKNKKAGNPINICDIRHDEWNSQTSKVFAGQLFWANAHYISKKVLSDNQSEAQLERDRILFSAVGMPDVLGDQSEWDFLAQGGFSTFTDRANKIDHQFNELKRRVAEAEAKALRAEAEANQQHELEKRVADAEANALRVEIEANLHLAQLNSIYRSASWRFTAPLRKLKAFFRR